MESYTILWKDDGTVTADSFFQPRSVVIIGASEAPGRIGSGLVETMRPAGIELLFVNPGHETLFGLPCYHSLRELPFCPSHAFIAVPRDHVLPYLRDCAALGIRNCVIISSGFKEKDADGAALERQIRELVSSSGITLLGPNTLGFINTAVGFNGTFLPARFESGPVSVISQSGGVGMALLSSLSDQRCGLAKWIGIGNEAGISAFEALEYLAGDAAAGAIAVCFEGVRDFGAFLRRAAEIQKKKPIVFLRDGKSGVGLRAAASHTGAMVFEDSVLSSLFRQFGLLEAASTRECAVMLKALLLAPRAGGRRAAILTNTAGPSVLSADLMEARGVSLPPLSGALSRSIDEEAGIPMGLKNPADISSNGLTPRNYGIAARRLLCSDEFDLLLGFFSLNPHLILPEKELIEAAKASGKPTVACFLSSQSVFAAYPLTIERAGVPCFCDPQDAAVACSAILSYGEALRTRSTPSEPLNDTQERDVSRLLLRTSSSILSERNSKELLAAAGIEVFVPLPAKSAEDAVKAAESCGYPVALKLESTRITHKSSVGGVRLHLYSAEAVSAAAGDMLPALRALDPEAALTVQPMSVEGFELILGAVRSPLGTLLMVGMGGRYAEALCDRAFCLWPASREALSAALRSLRCSRVLYDDGGLPLYDENALLSILGRMGALMDLFPRISELEINPCRITKDGLMVLDARAVLSP